MVSLSALGVADQGGDAASAAEEYAGAADGSGHAQALQRAMSSGAAGLGHSHLLQQQTQPGQSQAGLLGHHHLHLHHQSQPALLGPHLLSTINFRIPLALHLALGSSDQPLLVVDFRRTADKVSPWRCVLRKGADFEKLAKAIKKLLNGAKGVVPKLPSLSGTRDVNSHRLALTYYIKLLLVSETPRSVEDCIAAFLSDPGANTHLRGDWGRVIPAKLSPLAHVATAKIRGRGSLVQEGMLCQALTRSEWVMVWAVLYSRYLCILDKGLEGAKLISAVPLSAIEKIEPLPGPCGKPFGFFAVNTPSFSLYFMAESEERASEWADEIRSAMYIPDDADRETGTLANK